MQEKRQTNNGNPHDGVVEVHSYPGTLRFSLILAALFMTTFLVPLPINALHIPTKITNRRV